MDLKSILDSQARYVFFNKDQFSYAYPIVRVENNFLYFSSPQNITSEFDRGYVLASDESGIVQFTQPTVESLNQVKQKQIGLHLHRLDFKKIDYSITNRRFSERYEFKDYIPMTFNVFGENIPARLINISEGGLRMAVDTPIKSNILCHLYIKLPVKDEWIAIDTNGLIVYAGRENNSKDILVGLSFVTPEFVSAKDKKNYMLAQDMLKIFIKDNAKVA